MPAGYSNLPKRLSLARRVLHIINMTRIIQIRNVPEQTHRKLKACAAAHGMTLSGYLAKLIERDLSKPTREEIFARIQSRKPVRLSKTAAELIRDERDSN
jgi:antitoxin FitA